MFIKAPLDVTQIAFLKKIGMLQAKEDVLDSFKAGEGNMNVTLTIKTNKRTFILKQSRPFVAKYPHIPAPLERIEIEYKYYNAINKDNLLANFSPEILGFEKDSNLLALEFLDLGGDFLWLYDEKSILKDGVVDLMLTYLKRLHQLPVPDFPSNQEMRKLNHRHIFVFPYLSDNGFDLDDVQVGLQELSAIVKNNPTLIEKIQLLGEIYLRPGKVLIHGDFYPGSWFETGRGLKIIDTEFSFLGDPEFDLAIMLAHLKMAGTSENELQRIIKSYPLNNALLAQFTGAEILRRLFGLAQLPLFLSLVKKKELATYAINLIVNEKI
ncbi:phosphotransferase [uncultured Cyclobacterium sp.]|uniref:phosphotransferase n=1 Tax=uncultured Cyclobacterium sp. TaxID=453820 RepID=UPI0030ED1A22